MSARPPSAPGRLRWVDHLRAVLTILVVAHHAAQAYGPTGGAWPVANAERAAGLGVFISVNAMFFMSLFFFVSGAFTPVTLDRKGPKAFVTDRLWRLGVPSVVVVVATGLWMDRPQFLHLWFVVDLLALNLLYAAWRAGRPAAEEKPAASVTAAAPTAVDGRSVPATGAPPATPRAAVGRALFGVAGLVLLLTAGTALIRLWYPVDTWVQLLGVLPLEPAHGVHYATAFGLGLWAGRARWLERGPGPLGRILLVIGGTLVLAYATYRLWPDRRVSWFAGGGASWSMLRLAALETALCVSLGGGLLWAFQRWSAAPSRWLGALATDAYGIYLVHLPLVVLAQLAVAELPLGPWPRFALATSAALAASWALTRWGLRRGQLGRRIV